MTDQERRESKRWEHEGVMFLIYRNGRFLLEERIRPDSAHLGYTIIPGGTVEEGESHEQAFIRELEEEYGIKPVSYHSLGTFENVSLGGKHFLITAYLILNFEGELTNREPEKCRLRWVSLEKAESTLPLVSSKFVLLKGRQVLNEQEPSRG